MRVKIYLHFFFSFLIVQSAFALQVSEIQYDPAGADTDREWLEIYNDSSTTIKLTDYKFFEANTNHTISKTTEENISPGEYAVLVQDVAKYKIDNPNNALKIFTSSFSLSNSGESLALKDKSLNSIFTVDYTNFLTNTGNGTTINFKNGSAVNSGTTSTSTTATTTTQTATSTSAGETFQPTYFGRSYFPESEKILVNAGKNMQVLVGQEVNFSASAKTGENKELTSPTFFWSFGDATSAEGKSAKHDFKFIGEYVVVVEVYSNGNKETDRVYIKVIEPDVKLAIVTKKDLRAVNVFNNSNFEINLGNLVLNSSTTKYSLPKNFSILGKRGVDIAFETLKFATTTKGVNLNFENGKKIVEFYENASSTDSSILSTTSLATGTPVQYSPPFKGGVRGGFLKKQNYPQPYIQREVSTTPTPTITPTNVNNFIIKNQESSFSSFFKFFGL